MIHPLTIGTKAVCETETRDHQRTDKCLITAQPETEPLRMSRPIRAAGRGVVLFRVYADGNYWAGAGWEDDTVSDFDEGARRRESGFAGNACGSRESAGAAARGTRQIVQP